MSMFSDYTIVLPVDVEQKIMYWVDKAKTEISGLGCAEIDRENKHIIIKNAFLLKQECTGTETELDEKSIAKAMFRIHKESVASGIKQEIKFWWHSHVDMGVFWSKTDMEAMEMLGSHGWFAHIVFNKKNEMLGAISYPLKQISGEYVEEMVHVDESVSIANYLPLAKEATDPLDKEYEENYSEKKSSTVVRGGWGNSFWEHNDAHHDSDGYYYKGKYYKWDDKLDNYVKEKSRNKKVSEADLKNDEESLYEDEENRIYMSMNGTIYIEKDNRHFVLEYSPEKFSDGIIEKLSNNALAIMYQEVQDWKGKKARKIYQKLEDELCSRTAQSGGPQ